MGRMSFLSPNQQCQSTEENTEHWPKPVARKMLLPLRHAGRRMPVAERQSLLVLCAFYVSLFSRGWRRRTSEAGFQAASGRSEGGTENRLQQEDVLCMQRAGKAVDETAERDSTADQHGEKDQEVFHRKSRCAGLWSEFLKTCIIFVSDKVWNGKASGKREKYEEATLPTLHEYNSNLDCMRP